MKLIKEEYFEDEEGKKVRKIFDHGRLSISLLEPSQSYRDGQLKKDGDEAEKARKILNVANKIGQKVNQLGQARTFDPTRIATEDAVFKDSTDAMTTGELGEVVPKLQWLGAKTFQQVDTYIDDNVTDLQSAKAFLKILAKVVLATLKLVLILTRRELPPE